MRRFVALIAMLCSFLPLSAANGSNSPAHRYAVIFQVDVDVQGKITAFEVSKVIDPATGSSEPVDVPIPVTYVAVARKAAAARAVGGKAKRYFTYYLFDPLNPGLLADGP